MQAKAATSSIFEATSTLVQSEAPDLGALYLEELPLQLAQAVACSLCDEHQQLQGPEHQRQLEHLPNPDRLGPLWLHAFQ